MIYINAAGAVSALGANNTSIAHNLSAAHSEGMLASSDWLVPSQSAYFAQVIAPLPPIPPQFATHASRNNQLLLAALAQIEEQVLQVKQRYGKERIAVVLGTSTSGLDEGDQLFRRHAQGLSTPQYRYQQQELGDPSRFLRQVLDLHGPAYTISTACSSSARAIISGWRLIEAGVVDAAIVGGADSLSRMPINGFHALESLSLTPCQPFSRDRCGITIGEAAGLMLLSKQPAAVALLGAGESSDAYHMSAPHPQGAGAQRAMLMALNQANLAAQQLGYVNLHGTATKLNDEVEARVMSEVFAQQVPCSSTKHLTGHTLGAAGICEAHLCYLLLTQSLLLPAQDFSRSPLDDSLPSCGLLTVPQQLQRPWIMSNSFAFGGNNTSLIFGRTDG